MTMGGKLLLLLLLFLDTCAAAAAGIRPAAGGPWQFYGWPYLIRRQTPYNLQPKPQQLEGATLPSLHRGNVELEGEKVVWGDGGGYRAAPLRERPGRSWCGGAMPCRRNVDASLSLLMRMLESGR